MSLNEYLSEINTAISTINKSSLNQVLEQFKQTISENKKILVAGNGGSSAIASHFVIDLSRCTLGGKFQTRALSLNDNIPVLTATANDLGYEFIFQYQIERIAKAGDLFIAISSSGNSPNIVQALQSAKNKNVKTITFTGFDGGRASTMSDIAIVVKTEAKNYGPTEDAHAILCHYFSRLLK